jgi:hypothetical protein
MIFSLRNRLKILIYVGAGTLLLLGFLTKGPRVAGITVARLGIVETVIFVVIVAFNQWLWRQPLVVDALRTGPVLRGTWKGTSRTTHDGRERTAYLCIRQTFAELEVRLLSEESTSDTTSCQLVRKFDGLSVIEYSYTNTPLASVRDRSSLHLGAARLESTGQRPHRLEGSYWTDRRSTGDLTFTEHTPKILQSFADAESYFSK